MRLAADIMKITQNHCHGLALAAVLPFGTLLHEPAPAKEIYKHSPQGDLQLFCFKSAATTNPSRPTPAVLWIHGGGWTGGTCESFFPMARYTAARGAASFVAQYRLVRPGGPTVADSVADCQDAVRYLRLHAGHLGIDPQRIVLIGESAGGHLAACVGLANEVGDPKDEANVSARPDALILYNPLTDFTESSFFKTILDGPGNAADKLRIARELSPIFHVRSGLPPTLMVHGLADTVIYPEQSRRFAAAMKQAGNRCDLVLLSDTPHAFLIPEYKCSEAVVVDALRLGDKFLTALGYLSGEPTLTVDDPPAWAGKWPPNAAPQFH